MVEFGLLLRRFPTGPRIYSLHLSPWAVTHGWHLERLQYVKGGRRNRFERGTSALLRTRMLEEKHRLGCKPAPSAG